MHTPRSRRRAPGSAPPSVLILLCACVASAVSILAIGRQPRADLSLWTFARLHAELYEPVLRERVAERGGDAEIDLQLLSLPAMERRMLSGFLAETPVADLIEAERAIAGRAFLGPPEAIGFLDLTDRLREEGLLERINAPSFAAWTSRGRVYGIPHDVHPVVLGYRADIVEAAGIDVSRIETWDDFERVLRPLMTDEDGDGRPDRYLLGLWETDAPRLELLMLQAGGGFFDADGVPVLGADANARALARAIWWCAGPDPIATDVPDFTASGNKLKLDGFAIAYLMPDWMCDVWRKEIPQLAGRVKLMPLPAWERGGRRTSIWGGTMLGVARTSPSVERSWEAAKSLYLSRELARQWWVRANILTPVKEYWSDPVFGRPDPFFAEQRTGELFISLAPDVPLRHASPYFRLANDRLRDAAIRLAALMRSGEITTLVEAEREAKRLLLEAEAIVRRWRDRNVFVSDASG